LIPSPIHKVLSTMSQHGVQCLLMGGQACVLYGAAEFSRDTDFAILAEQKNLDILRRALADLQAETIAVPPLEKRFLDRGHAVHFRCAHPEALRLRIDVMARMRGTEDFAALWQRRTTFDLPFGLSVEAMSLPDLVQAKKTQRNKDWPMIQRLLEANYFENRQQPTPQRIVFWLRELRTAPLLIEAAASFPSRAAEIQPERPLVKLALFGETDQLEAALDLEQKQEQALDRQYWLPLKAELEVLRRERAGQTSDEPNFPLPCPLP
jgi:hypothetical protein